MANQFVGNIKTWIGKNPDRAFIILLFLLGFLQYANTLGHDYAWDDALVITENSRTQKGFAGIPEHFEMRTRVKQEDFTGYRPVTLTSFSIDIGLFGMKPFFGHLMNVILFALLCVIIYSFFRKLLPHYHRGFAFLVTLIFLVHPVHAEVVANIKSRDEILAMLFGMLSLIYFIRFCKTGKWLQILPVTVFFLLSVFSRENGMLFLAAYPLTAYMRPGTNREKLKKLVVLPVLIIALTGSFYALTGNVPGEVAEVNTEGVLEPVSLGNAFAHLEDTKDKFAASNQMVFLNAKKFFVPYPLVYFTGPDYLIPLSYRNIRIGLILTFHVLILAWLIFNVVVGRRKTFVFGGFWFLIFISLFVQLIYPLADTLADRYLFIPSLGLGVFFLSVLSGLGNIEWENEEKENTSGPLPSGNLRGKIALGVLMAMILTASLMTLSRNNAWKDNATLFSTDMPELETCAKAHYFMANELSRQFEYTPSPQKKQDLLRHYKRAIEIAPEGYYSHVFYVQNLLRFDEFQQAETAMDTAIKFFPGQGDLYFYRGKARYFLDKFDAAVQDLAKSRAMNPGPAETWEYEGRALSRAGKFPEAEQLLLQAEAKFPQDLLIKDALVISYMESGRSEAGLRKLEEIIQKDDQNPIWWQKIIGFFQQMGQNDLANHYYQQALARGIQL